MHLMKSWKNLLKNEIIILQLIKHYLTLVEGVDKQGSRICMLGFDEIMNFLY